MNPLEAMARSVHYVLYHPLAWQDAPSHIKDQCLAIARATRDAMADNVSDGMSIAYQCARLRKPKPGNINQFAIAAAIRAAGEKQKP